MTISQIPTFNLTSFLVLTIVGYLVGHPKVKHALLLQLKSVSVTSVYGGNIVKIIINDVIKSAVAIQKRWNNGRSVNKENF
jgi:hypothetical protein